MNTGYVDGRRKLRGISLFRILMLLWLLTGMLVFLCAPAWAAKTNAHKDPSFAKTSLTVKVGSSVTLKLKNNNKSVYWRVSDKTVLALSKKRREGVTITGKKKGTAVVSGDIWGTDIILRCIVKVEKKVRLAVVDVPSVNRSGNAGSVVAALRRCGASASLIRSANFDVSKYDGLVLPGGIDVNPSAYHEKRSSRVTLFSTKLDQVQLGAIRKFVQAKKPILGICRGLQILNVYFGGTLKQHISGHGGGRHSLSVVPGSMMYGLYGGSVSVPTSHHQCAKKLGRGLKITQRAKKDNNVEAIEHETLPIVAVQWHPELSGSTGTKLFKAFIAMCAR